MTPSQASLALVLQFGKTWFGNETEILKFKFQILGKQQKDFGAAGAQLLPLGHQNLWKCKKHLVPVPKTVLRLWISGNENPESCILHKNGWTFLPKLNSISWRNRQFSVGGFNFDFLLNPSSDGPACWLSAAETSLGRMLTGWPCADSVWPLAVVTNWLACKKAVAHLHSRTAFELSCMAAPEAPTAKDCSLTSSKLVAVSENLSSENWRTLPASCNMLNLDCSNKMVLQKNRISKIQIAVLKLLRQPRQGHSSIAECSHNLVGSKTRVSPSLGVVIVFAIASTFDACFASVDAVSFSWGMFILGSRASTKPKRATPAVKPLAKFILNKVNALGLVVVMLLPAYWIWLSTWRNSEYDKQLLS